MMYHFALLNTIIVSFLIIIPSYIEVGAVSYSSRSATATSQRELGVGGRTNTNTNGRTGGKGGKAATYHGYYGGSYDNKYKNKIEKTDPTSSPVSATATTTNPTTSPDLDEPDGRVPVVMRPVPPDAESMSPAPSFSPFSNVGSVQTVSPAEVSSIKKPVPIPIATELNSDLTEGDNYDPIIEAPDSDSEGSELLILDSDSDNDNGGESSIQVETDGSEDLSVVNGTAVDEDGPLGGVTEGGNDERESITSIDSVNGEMSTNETGDNVSMAGDNVSMVQIGPIIETDDETAEESNEVITPSQGIEGEDNTGEESDEVVTPSQGIEEKDNTGEESDEKVTREEFDEVITPSQEIEEVEDNTGEESNEVVTPSQEIEEKDNTGEESDEKVTREEFDEVITPSQEIEEVEDNTGEESNEVVTPSQEIEEKDNTGEESDEKVTPSQGIGGEESAVEGSSVEIEIGTGNETSNEGKENGNVVKYPFIGNENGNAGGSGGKPPSQGVGNKDKEESGTENNVSNDDKTNNNSKNGDTNEGDSNGAKPSQGIGGEGNKVGPSIGTESDNKNHSSMGDVDIDASVGNKNPSVEDPDKVNPYQGIEGEGNKVEGTSVEIVDENNVPRGNNDNAVKDPTIVESGNDANEGGVNVIGGAIVEGNTDNGKTPIGSGTQNDSDEGGLTNENNEGNLAGEGGSDIGEVDPADAGGSGSNEADGGLTNENNEGNVAVEAGSENGEVDPADAGGSGSNEADGGLTNENNEGNVAVEAGSENGEVDPADAGGSGSNEADQEIPGTVDLSNEGNPVNEPEDQASDRSPANGPRDQISEGNGTDVGGDSDNSAVEKGEETESVNNGEEGRIGSNTREEVTVNYDEGVENSTTAVFCPGKPVDKSVSINWIYAVEFFPDLTEEQMTEAMAIMELKLVSEVLNCNSLPSRRYFRHRHLFVNNVAGLDYMPLDAKNEDVVCFSNSTARGVCETYYGRMVMYLENDADEQVAVNDMLYSIRNTMQRYDFPSMNKIVQTWYLEPELNDASGISDGSDVIADKKQSIDNSFSAGAVTAFAALGIFVIAALVLGIFRMRRRQPDGVSTLGPGSYLTTQTNNEYTLKQTPFSTMLPNSYKLDEPDTMSCIMEGDYDSDKCQNSVIVSDGGYTSDGGSQQNEIYPPHLEPVLGAQKIDEENMETDRELLFDNDDISSMGKSILTGVSFDPNREEFTERDLSNHRKQNLVSGADVSLGGRHSSVDVHECKSVNCKTCQYQPKDVEFIRDHCDSPDVSAGARYHESYEQDF